MRHPHVSQGNGCLVLISNTPYQKIFSHRVVASLRVVRISVAVNKEFERTDAGGKRWEKNNGV